MYGVLNVYKPLHFTSHDVVAKLRKIFNFKKIGHLGTLDPLAEGVLPVCFGNATRLIEYFPSGKAYRAQITLGIETTTLDAEGEITSEKDASGITSEVLQSILLQLSGTIQQQVPLYSAVHVDGKKLYKHARKGDTETLEKIELPTKTVTIHNLALLDFPTRQSAHPVFSLNVDCSSGTYIRSLARDIGQALGCGAHLSGLVRTRHGHFGLETAIFLETLAACENPAQYLLDPAPFLEIPTLTLHSEETVKQLRHGMMTKDAETNGQLTQDILAYAIFEGAGVGVIQQTAKGLKPLKIFA